MTLCVIDLRFLYAGVDGCLVVDVFHDYVAMEVVCVEDCFVLLLFGCVIRVGIWFAACMISLGGFHVLGRVRLARLPCLRVVEQDCFAEISFVCSALLFA